MGNTEGEAMLGTQKIVLLLVFCFCAMKQHELFAMESKDAQVDEQDLSESFHALTFDGDDNQAREEIKAPRRQKILLFKALSFFVQNEDDDEELLRFFRLSKVAPQEALQHYRDCKRQQRNQRLTLRYTFDIHFLNDLIKNYGELKHRGCQKSRQVINHLALEALDFFITIINDQDVLSKIFHSVKLFPDRAIKLYFFCHEYYCLNRFDDNLIRYIERFIQRYFLCRPHYDLQFLTFKRDRDGLPMLAMRDYAEWHGDIYEVVAPKIPWCYIL